MSSTKIVVGLGNPGKHYAYTPHNVGFAVIDELASGFSCVLRRSFSFRARIGLVVSAKGSCGSEEKLLLVKPQTYMNRSGTAVASVLRYRKLTASDMIVVLDDADLDFGQLRIRARGSSGGHKGLTSVIQAMGSEEFARVRIGIGRDNNSKGLVEHVLTPFSAAEWQEMKQIIRRAAQAVLCILNSGVETAMNRFN